MEQANDSNLPVDSAVFLEFLPGSHQYLLVVSKAACGDLTSDSVHFLGIRSARCNAHRVAVAWQYDVRS